MTSLQMKVSVARDELNDTLMRIGREVLYSRLGSTPPFDVDDRSTKALIDQATKRRNELMELEGKL